MSVNVLTIRIFSTLSAPETAGLPQSKASAVPSSGAAGQFRKKRNSNNEIRRFEWRAPEATYVKSLSFSAHTFAAFSAKSLNVNGHWRVAEDRQGAHRITKPKLFSAIFAWPCNLQLPFANIQEQNMILLCVLSAIRDITLLIFHH
jgi:hypothetical protein